MAWVDIIQEEGIQFYSVSDSVEQLHETFFSFWMSVTPGMLLLFFLATTVLISIGILYSVFRSIKGGAI